MGTLKTVETNSLSTSRQDKKEQWPQKAAWKIAVGHDDKLFHQESGEVQEQAPQRGCGFSVLGGVHGLVGQSHG